MEVVEGKSTNKKVVIAQEIAFAKVLAGNNKTLRDRAVKKLKKWLTARGNGKWTFTEDELIRIWTGLFYCMWMSDKFLVQEELAESISSLIHCFKKNNEAALLFIKCFYKRILMEWEGLDQYRIDKFNMLARRFLRQALVYCKEKNWEEPFLSKLMDIFFNVVLHRDNSLGFVLHFISIYAEELAKVSKGKVETGVVLKLIEPFVKTIARTREKRVQREALELFNYLMRQTDTGIEFEEQFNAWRQQGFPGTGPQVMKKIPVSNGNGISMENGNESSDNSEDEGDEPLDPRAGSVHVFLPQIPLDIDGMVKLLKKHEKSKLSHVRGKRALRSLSERFSALKRGKFPVRIKKDPILDEKLKKKRLSMKNARELLKFTESLDEGPIKTKEYQDIEKELEGEAEDDEDNALDENPTESEDNLEDSEIENDDGVEDEDEEVEETEEEEVEEVNTKLKKEIKSNSVKKNNINPQNILDTNKKTLKPSKTRKDLNGMKQNKKDEAIAHKENQEDTKSKPDKAKRKKLKRKKAKEEPGLEEKEVLNPKKKRKSLGGSASAQEETCVGKEASPGNAAPLRETGSKRKILSNWQVQEMDPTSPEYYKIETPKIIRIERKIDEASDGEENEEPTEEPGNLEENEWECEEEEETREVLPAFWEKAKAKVEKKKGKKSKVFVNPFAVINGESKSPGMRRISFALERNMAQENEEYLAEVKNSPTVPFDGTKKPVQSALKSGLSPSPVNPFYRFKKIKF